MSISTINSPSPHYPSHNRIPHISNSTSPKKTHTHGYSQPPHNKGFILIACMVLMSGVLMCTMAISYLIQKQLQEHRHFTQFIKIHHIAMSGFVDANVHVNDIPTTLEPVSKSQLIAHKIPYRNATFSSNGTLSLVKTNRAVYSIAENPPYRAIYRREYTTYSNGQIQSWGHIEKY